MDTLEVITTDITMIANKLGAIKRSEDIDERQLNLWVRQYREKWISDTFKRDRNLYYTAKQSLVQDMGCVLLDCVDQSECSGLPTGQFVSKAIIPARVELEGCLDYVGVINKRKNFRILESPNELAGHLAAPYSEKFVFAWTIGPNALYVATQDTELYMDMCYVNIRGIFADPTQVCYKKSLSTASCCYNRVTDAYPATGEMISDIKMMILTREMNISMQYYKDFINDTQDDRNFQPNQRYRR